MKSKSKAKRKSNSRGDDVIADHESDVQLFSTQTVQSALKEKRSSTRVELLSKQLPGNNQDDSNDHEEEITELQAPKSRVRQQLEARSELKALLQAITTGCQGCVAQLKALRQRVEDGQLETEHGVSFLDVSTWFHASC